MISDLIFSGRLLILLTLVISDFMIVSLLLMDAIPGALVSIGHKRAGSFLGAYWSFKKSGEKSEKKC